MSTTHMWLNTLAILTTVIAVLVIAVDVRAVKRMCLKAEEERHRRNQKAAAEAEATYRESMRAR